MTQSQANPLNILLLAQINLNNAQTVVDHVYAFHEFSRHRVFTVPWMGQLPEDLRLDRFDVVVVHYTVVPFLPSFITDRDRENIRSFRGLKVGFRQDEYQKINLFHQALRDLKYHLFYTCIPERSFDIVYPKFLLPGIVFKNTLTGCVPESFVTYPRRPIAERTLHVGYRARSCPFWYGDLTYEKVAIAAAFSEACTKAGLACDVNAREGERLYGKEWADFLGNCKTMLGTESGASVLDFNGELEEQWTALTKSPFTCEGVTSISYQDYRNQYLRGRQRHGLMNQISPRVFEAAAMGTALVLYEGEYSGILKPDRHYIPVKKNHSNMADVLRKMRDDRLLQEMADRAHEEIARNPQYGYRHFVERFDADVETAMTGKDRTKHPYTHDEFSLLLDRHGYVSIPNLIDDERTGRAGCVRPFDIPAMPYTHGLKPGGRT